MYDTVIYKYPLACKSFKIILSYGNWSVDLHVRWLKIILLKKKKEVLLASLANLFGSMKNMLLSKAK